MFLTYFIEDVVMLDKQSQLFGMQEGISIDHRVY